MPALRFGLALGGGGARGIAHIGILRGLEDLDIRPEIVSGTSIGALIGALFVRYGSASAVHTRLVELINSKAFMNLGLHLINVSGRGGGSFWHQAAASVKDRIVINLAQSKPGLVRSERVREALAVVLDEDCWNQDGRRLGVVATDLLTGEDVHLTDGSLLDAVMASMAIPGFVPPQILGDRTLVDGGVSQILPVKLNREMGADFVLGVDVGAPLALDGPLNNAMAIMNQSERITALHFRRRLAREADLVIRPEFGVSHWSEFNRMEEFTLAGVEAFEENANRLVHQWYRRRHPVLGFLKQLLSFK